jgi:hypothetical protein
LDKFRGKGGKWREQIQQVEEDIPEVAVNYSLREDEPERGKERVGREGGKERVGGGGAGGEGGGREARRERGGREARGQWGAREARREVGERQGESWE